MTDGAAQPEEVGTGLSPMGGEEFGRGEATCDAGLGERCCGRWKQHCVDCERRRISEPVCEYWCGDYAPSAHLCRELLADANLPVGERERVKKNLAFAVSKL